MPRYQIKPFSNYVLRTPVFPLSGYLKLLEDYSEKELHKLVEDPYFEEAIHIASPDLALFLKKYIQNPETLTKERKRNLEFTFLKYLARCSSRCTPFGLFAGCSVGSFEATTAITIAEKEKHVRVSQLDMHFWTLIIQKLGSNHLVRNHLRYFPNTSLYKLGDFYRYVEFTYHNLKREHRISALKKSPTLEKLLHYTKVGATVEELIAHLAEDEHEKEEARLYLNNLIDAQFLRSELDVRVTGNDQWSNLFTILDKTIIAKEKVQVFRDLKLGLDKLNQNVIPSPGNYQQLDVLIEKTGVEVDRKYLFQTDLNISTYENKLDTSLPLKTLEALRFLNGIQPKTRSVNLNNFVKAFSERYESREMPLATVLDSEAGIGYLQHGKMNDTHPILDRFSFKRPNASKVSQTWSDYDYLLEEKLKNCLMQNQAILCLSESDFPVFNSDWQEMPATFSVMVELVKNKGVETVVFESSGNTSAAKLLGRFCNGNSAIHKLTQDIIEKEEALQNEKIFAEIVHVPEARTCNVLRRPVLRTYEIPYLCNPGVEPEQVIDLEDLTISIRNETVVLRSKKHNKEVVPCLSSAHNYSGTVLPVYHFLCDLQFQHNKPIYNFSWGVLEHHHRFFPRVLYKEVVLAKAKWIVDKEELQRFYGLRIDAQFEQFLLWKQERQLPKYVNWVLYDNTLLLDLDQRICMELFLKSVEKSSKIILEEFLFSEEAIVKDSGDRGFTNQALFFYYKQTA